MTESARPESRDERPRCEHGVVYPDDHCADCLKRQLAEAKVLLANQAQAVIAMNTPRSEQQAFPFKAIGYLHAGNNINVAHVTLEPNVEIPREECLIYIATGKQFERSERGG